MDIRSGIIWAYRLLLNREPQNEQDISRLMHISNVQELRAIFTGSQEFRNLYNIQQVGQFANAGAVNIQTECTPEEIEAITDRIASEWRKFGATEPHWSVLTGDEYLASNIDQSIGKFYESGDVDLGILLKGIERSGLNVKFDRALDYGCGVGRLSLALAKRVNHVWGIDISPGHVKLARARALETGISNAEFTSISYVNELSRFRDISLIISYLVIQHNPPPIQAMIVRYLLNALRVGGIAVLQIPTYLVSATNFVVSDYLSAAQPAMEMNAIPQNRIFDIIHECGCKCLEVREDGVLGPLPGISQTFTIQRV